MKIKVNFTNPIVSSTNIQFISFKVGPENLKTNLIKFINVQQENPVPLCCEWKGAIHLVGWFETSGESQSPFQREMYLMEVPGILQDKSICSLTSTYCRHCKSVASIWEKSQLCLESHKRVDRAGLWQPFCCLVEAVRWTSYPFEEETDYFLNHTLMSIPRAEHPDGAVTRLWAKTG